MRTTLTIDDALMQRLQDMAHRRGVSFKQVVNEVLARGIEAVQREPEAGEFRVEAVHCGVLPGVDYGKLNQLGDELEIDRFAADPSFGYGGGRNA